MKQATLPTEEIEVIAATRFLFGIGIALLLGHYLTRSQRRWAGWTLLSVGALSTPPLIYDVYHNRTNR